MSRIQKRKKAKAKTKKQIGVYILMQNSKIVYIGKSGNFISRLITHVKEKKKSFNKVMFKPLSKSDTDIIEVLLIDKHKPKYNKEFKHEDQNTTLKIDVPKIDEFEKYDFMWIMRKYRFGNKNFVWKDSSWKIKYRIFGFNLHVTENSIIDTLLFLWFN